MTSVMGSSTPAISGSRRRILLSASVIALALLTSGCTQSTTPEPALPKQASPLPRFEYAPYSTPSGYVPRPFQWVPPQPSGPPVPPDPELDRVLRGLVQPNRTVPRPTVPKEDYLLLYWIARLRPLPEVERAAELGALDYWKPGSASDPRLLRFIDPDYRPSSIGCTPDDTPSLCLLYHALYCDVLPLPSNLLSQINSRIRLDNSIHSALIFGLAEMERRGCATAESRQTLQDASDLLLRQMADSFGSSVPAAGCPKDAPHECDIFAERAFALMSAGAKDRIQPEWMTAVERSLKARLPLLEQGDASVITRGALWEALATLLWKQGRGA